MIFKGIINNNQTSKQTKLMKTENRLMNSENQGVKTKLTTKGFENLGGRRYYSNSSSGQMKIHICQNLEDFKH